MAVEKKNKGLTDKEEFSALLSAKRHDELKVMLLDILKELKTPTVNTEYREIDTKGLEAAIKDIQVSVDLSEIPNSISALINVIDKKLDAINNSQPKVWEFDIIRGKDIRIKKVIAKPKQ